jgi:MYXO-CTERM domain-containing protein
MTQITGEKMLFSISQQQTTLYDEITYSGEPSSFAWVLPIHGVATVGLSSDALFQNLGQDTSVTITPPPLYCNPGGCPGGAFGSAASSSASGAGGASTTGPVTVISQAVVGPYEEVQLQSTDPLALRNWLTMHGYNIPATDGPVIDAYTAEGFNFLALKLVPGMGVSNMRPVRVTTMGATPSLPLRMVAVGSGPIVPITLWVVAEGRYTTANMSSSTIDPKKLVWDWDTQSSNYTTLKQDIFTQSNNTAWVVEAAEPFSMFTLQSQLQQLVEFDPMNSGYADAMGMNASKNLADDMAVLFAGIPAGTMWITRFEGALSHAALSTDLQVMASADQSQLPRVFQLTNTTGTAPTCPPPPTCGGSGGSGGSTTGSSTTGGWGFWGNNGTPSSGGGCATTSKKTDASLLTGIAALAALALARRRARRA